MAKKQVLVRRLVSIEDFGNIELLFTDKTGTLTEGRITYSTALDTSGADSQRVLLLGLLCNDAAVEDGVPVGGNPLDQARRAMGLRLRLTGSMNDWISHPAWTSKERRPSAGIFEFPRIPGRDLPP